MSEKGPTKPCSKSIDFTSLTLCQYIGRKSVLFWTIIAVIPRDTYPEHTPGRELLQKSAGKILEAASEQYPMNYPFDVFLSHSYNDARLNSGRLLGVTALLEYFGLDVYVDWLIDTNLDRERVSSTTAHTLRKRMNRSKCLLFATSETSQESKWMPWELGYMDGKKQMVAIFPLVTVSGRERFRGQEYLGMYPYIEKAPAMGTTKEYLWVCKDQETYVCFDEWLEGGEPYKH